MILSLNRLLEMGLPDEEAEKYAGMHLNTDREDISDEEIFKLIDIVKKIKARRDYLHHNMRLIYDQYTMPDP